MGEAMLIQVIQSIRLIFLLVQSLFQEPAPCRILLDARIVTRRYIRRTEFHCPRKQALELHIAVTRNAWIRRPAFRIVREKIIDDLLAEEFLEIHHIMGNADDFTNAARISHGAQRAAASVIFLEVAALIGKAHRNTDDIIPLFLEQGRRQRTVYTAAHTNDDTFFSHCFACLS